MSLLFLLFLVPHLCLVASQATSQPKTVFLLAGQSNMAGRGGVTNDSGTFIWDGIVPSECLPNPSILRLDANLNWVEAREPLHVDIDDGPNRANGIGPGMPFARAILKKKTSFGTVGLVPCAYGGSHISEWQRGTNLYSKMIKRAEASVKHGAKIGALLWWQGGSDAEKIEDAMPFKEKTIKFFNDVRADLKSPDLPIFQVAVANGTRKYSYIISRAQLSIHLPNLKALDAPRLPVQPDGVHLTSQSQVIFGTDLAKEYLSLDH